LSRQEFVDAHVAEDGDVLGELSAQVIAFADATMHPATATLLERNPLVAVQEFGYESKVASAQIEIAALVRVDLVVDVDAATLRSVATVADLRPLSPAEVVGPTPEAG
jgi:hypothetical protein